MSASSAVEASRKAAAEARLASFIADCKSVTGNPTPFSIRLGLLATLTAQHIRRASAALPQDLVAALENEIAAHVRSLL